MRGPHPSRDDLEDILVRPPDDGDYLRPWGLPFPDATSQLEAMAALRDRGLLSTPEYESQKARILRSGD